MTIGLDCRLIRDDLRRCDGASADIMPSTKARWPGTQSEWHPHMMVYPPYYDDEMPGGNQPEELPIVADDAGTPFAVTVIPVAHELAVKAQRH